MRSSVSIDLAGNLTARARQYGQALEGMSQRGQRSMRALSGMAGMVGKGMDAMSNRYTAAASALGGGMMVKNVMDLQMRMTRLGITADATDAEIQNLKQSIYAAAESPDIRVDPAQIISGLEAILEKTGDMQFATDNVKNLAYVIQATGAQGEAAGEIFAEFQKQGIVSSQEVLETIAILNNQGKMGAFTLQNLASLGPRVVTAYTSMGRSGKEAMREMGAVLQVIRQGTGSSEQATTAWEALMRAFSDTNKLKILQKNGIKVFDPEALKRGQEILRPAPELLKEILLAAHGKKTNLSQVFDAEALKAFSAITGELIRTGKIESLDQFMQASGDPASLLNDSARAANTAASAMESLSTAWGRFADRKLTEPIQKAADLLNSLGGEDSQKLLDYAGTAAVGVGGLIAARKTYAGGRAMYGGIRGMFGSKGGSGVAGGLAGLGGLPVPLPVTVTNLHALGGAVGGVPGRAGRRGLFGRRRAGGRGGLAGVALMAGAGMLVDGEISPLDMAMGAAPEALQGAGRAASGARGFMRGAGRLAGRAGGAMAVGGAVLDGAMILSDDSLSREEKIAGLSEAGGAAAGGMAGAALGAAIGTAIFPGVGTAIGGLLGGWLGSEGGQRLGAALSDNIAQVVQGLDAASEKVSGWISSLWEDEKPQGPGIERNIAQFGALVQQGLQENAMKANIKISVDGPAKAAVTESAGVGTIDVYTGRKSYDF